MKNNRSPTEHSSLLEWGTKHKGHKKIHCCLLNSTDKKVYCLSVCVPCQKAYVIDVIANEEVKI